MNEPCPFKVGQRIHETVKIVMGDDVTCTTLDSTKPDATVAAITENGFTYEYDNPIPFGRAAWGEMMTGGECYPEGYAYWRAVD